MIKAIVFDYAGVIGPGALLGWVKEHTTEENRMLEHFREHSHEWDLGEVNEEEFKSLISRITGISPDEVWNTLYEPSVCDEEVMSLIYKLKSQYKTVLFSDNFAPFLRQLLDKLDIKKAFDDVLISSDYHVRKPDPKFFDILLEKLALRSDEVVFTDDTLGNVEAALTLGIHAIHFQSASQLEVDLKKLNVTS